MTPVPLRTELFTPKFVEKFWSKVNKTDSCWLWTGNITSQGYAQVNIGYPKQYHYIASRVSYYLAYGLDPYPLDILHKCDNLICIRPDHLFTGTQADNNRDMVNKHRNKGPANASGSNNGCAILDETLVAHIRWYLANGYTNDCLAKAFYVHPSTISAIKLRRSWPNIEPIDPNC
jgi:hypothetical protein